MFQKAPFVAGTILGLAAAAQAVAEWGQCGGIGWTGGTTCDSGLTCTKLNDYYYQCLKSSSTAKPPSSTAKPPTSTAKPPSSTQKPPSSSQRPPTTSTVSPPPVTSGACGTFGNPYQSGYSGYISPYYSAEVDAAIAGMTDSSLIAKAQKVKQIPNFTWFDVASKVPTLGDYLADAKSQQTSSDKKIVQIVIYDLPNRDCHAKASNGELLIAQDGVNKYKDYINAISAQVSAYPDVRVVAVVEPDSLANLVTNMSDQNCANAHDAYLQCTTYVLQTLKQCNIWLYLDAGHAGWLGWASNIGPAAQLFAQVYKSATPNRVRGLATNVANYNALSAATPDPVTSGDPNTDELKYITALGPQLQSQGFPASFIVDQGRSGVQNIRNEWGDWCNIKGAGFGMRPTSSTPSSLIDAIVWVKPGGESDGTSDSSAPRFDSTCSLSDAKQPAPQAGQWFEAYFEDLLKNANPAL